MATQTHPTVDAVNEFFRRHYPSDWQNQEARNHGPLGVMRRYAGDSHASVIFPCMMCADGFSMSVQGHNGAYSSPRSDFAESYTAVEVGFPSAVEPLLMPYVEDAERPTDTVYGYVPVSVVCEVLAKHGGLVPSVDENGALS